MSGQHPGEDAVPEIVALRSIVRRLLDGDLPVEDERKGWWWWGTDEDGMPSVRVASLTTDEADALVAVPCPDRADGEPDYEPGYDYSPDSGWV